MSLKSILGHYCTMPCRLLLFALLLVIVAPLNTRAAETTNAAAIRPVPPPGITIVAEVASNLLAGVSALDREIHDLEADLKGKPGLLSFLPDIEIFSKAVRYAVIYQEFYNSNEVQVAFSQLTQGRERAAQLKSGEASWNTRVGLVARGYRSRIDGSVQPYGLVVPASYHSNAAAPYRLDIWFHGRGETLTELNFLNERQKSRGEFAPANAFVLHLYGRYCNANKFAGEIDLFEALAEVRRHYPIDEDRVVVRGFSMGGAACWQFAVHYPGLWAAAAPGAGFAETADFLRVFQNESVAPAWYEQRLWRLYDCTEYALNLFHCPTVAYSGEIDRQKQAADIMAARMDKEGLKLTHIIGPQTAHKYHPAAKEEINRRIDSIARLGRTRVPPVIHFTTSTLRYNEVAWLTLDRLGQHWERARVDAEISLPARVNLQTTNVEALTLSFEAGLCPLDPLQPATVQIDGKVLRAGPVWSDRSWRVQLEKNPGGAWAIATAHPADGLRKVHGLQGPIDDAFMDSFLMVRPSGTPLHPQTGQWVQQEQQHAIEHWRRQFRGDCRVVSDTEVSDEQIQDQNLVLWGDPQSNQLLKRIADKIPIRWDSETVAVGRRTFPAAHHMAALIYPNPLNPRRYVVLNSGFTFREYDYLNNARQVPKLPDYALIDIRTPPTPRSPGAVAAAGFFNERWELPATLEFAGP